MMEGEVEEVKDIGEKKKEGKDRPQRGCSHVCRDISHTFTGTWLYSDIKNEGKLVMFRYIMITIAPPSVTLDPSTMSSGKCMGNFGVAGSLNQNTMTEWQP